MSVKDALEAPRRDSQRIVLPPASFLHEQEKVKKRWPAAIDFIKSRKLNEIVGPKRGRIGIVLQGGMYNGVIRALQRLGLADLYGTSMVPLYILNVTYPLVDDEFLSFCKDKDAVLVVEEGQPDHLEQAFGHMLHKAEAKTRLHGKSFLPMAGEYTGQVMLDGFSAFLRAHAPELLTAKIRLPNAPAAPPDLSHLARVVPMRPPDRAWSHWIAK